MKIAIPLANGKLAMHFGHCASFAIIDIDEAKKEISAMSEVQAPPHEPGLLPKWLGKKEVTHIIAGGMGNRAQALFDQNGIKVIVGASDDTPENLVKTYLAGTLETGDNACSH
jgi:predicted Fe-Mo cluster-binding NifX family protein